MPGYGQGRLSILDSPLSLQHCVDMIKSHLHLSSVRLACAVGQNTRKFNSQVLLVDVCSLLISQDNDSSDVDVIDQPVTDLCAVL